MKYIKYLLPILVIFLTIGYAATNVTLSITGDAFIASDLEKFDVYISSITLDGIDDLSLYKDTMTVEFTSTKARSEPYEISVQLTNNSSEFDALIGYSCEITDATTLVDEPVISGVIESKTSDLVTFPFDVSNQVTEKSTIKCTFVASPIERNAFGEGDVDGSILQKYALLKSTTSSDTTAFRASTYKNKIKTITFEKYPQSDNKTYLETWEIGDSQYGSIKAYISTNSSNSSYYDLYIRSNSIIFTNSDMSYWFSGFSSLEAINGLDLLNISLTTNMSYMFYNSSSLLSLDLSSFDTSNVTNMESMFSGCSKLTTIYVSDGWVIDNVTTSTSQNMFYGTTSLVGGAGTTYNSSYINKTYARFDDGPTSSEPGYLTNINQQTGSVTISSVSSVIEYTGTKQQLIKSASATGTVYYRVNGGSWTTSKPSATDIGTYVIEYYAAANKNYKKSDIGKVTIDIIKYTHTVTLKLVNKNGVALSNVEMYLRQRLVGKDPTVIATGVSDSSGVIVFDNLRLSGGYILDCDPVDTTTYNWNFGANNRVRSVSYTSGDITILTITSAASTLGTWQDAQINSVTPNINIRMNCVLYNNLTQTSNSVLSIPSVVPSYLRNTSHRMLINNITLVEDKTKRIA